MVRRRSVLSPFVALLAVACGPAEVRRIVLDAALVPSACEVQEVGPHRHVVQTFAAPDEPIAGVEVFASRYPGRDSLSLMIRVSDEARELGCDCVAIPDRLPMPVRMVFPPARAQGVVTLEAWAPDAQTGRGAAIRFVPVDCYEGGGMQVAGRPARGDIAFRVLARDTSSVIVVTGIDLAWMPGRFPSENLAVAGELRQEFVATRDSLAGVEFFTATGGRTTGSGLGWALEVDGAVVREGRLPCVEDNAMARMEFAPVDAKGRVCAVRLFALETGEVRVWLCRGTAEMRSLTVRDNLVGGSLVMTALHHAPRSDSMRVVLSIEGPPSPVPTGFLVGDCRVTQTVRWSGVHVRPDRIGFRTALGGRIVTGSLAYEIGDERCVVFRDSLSIAGEGSDDFVWMRLSSPDEATGASVTVGGVGATVETAARLWWMPADIHRGGEASGCVPTPGGDCELRLAKRYTPEQWLAACPRLLREQALSPHGRLLDVLLSLRGVLLSAAVLAGILARAAKVGSCKES